METEDGVLLTELGRGAVVGEGALVTATGRSWSATTCNPSCRFRLVGPTHTPHSRTHARRAAGRRADHFQPRDAPALSRPPALSPAATNETLMRRPPARAGRFAATAAMHCTAPRCAALAPSSALPPCGRVRLAQTAGTRPAHARGTIAPARRRSSFLCVGLIRSCRHPERDGPRARELPALPRDTVRRLRMHGWRGAALRWSGRGAVGAAKWTKRPLRSGVHRPRRAAAC